MGSSPDDEDVERVTSRHVPDDAETDAEVRRALREAGIENPNSLNAFADRILSLDAALDATPEQRPGHVVTRSEVDAAVGEVDSPVPESRRRAVADAAAREIGAPTDAALDQARRTAIQQLDGSTLRSNPDLDPLAQGGEGREIVDIQSADGGVQENVTEVVEKSGERTATFYYEGSDGTRYPMAEVDL